MEMVSKIATDQENGQEYEIKIPATPVVKKALIEFNYPAQGIRISSIADALAAQFELSDEQVNAKHKNGFKIWLNHVNTAANALEKSEKLFKIRRGWIINPSQFEGFTPDDASPNDEDTLSPEVVMERKYQDHRDRLKEELLLKIMDNPSDFFEELVLDLLVEMGYGGSRADAAAVGRSGDGGIDGIINQDQLGLDAIYVQAKRWTEGNVGSPDIDKFSGALTRQGASKGVFITTSGFTPAAQAAANESAGPKIILIDGKQLVQLMIDHEVGVSLGNFYQLKEVDQDYFAIDDAVDDA